MQSEKPVKRERLLAGSGKQAVLSALLQVPAGGGGGDGFEQLAVVFAGEGFPREMTLGSGEAFVSGQRLWDECGNELLQRLLDDAEGKMDEGGGVAAAVGGFERRVVFPLMLADQRFDGDEFEGGVVVVKKQCVPESSNPSVPILEGVDELQLVVENAGTDQRMGCFVFEEFDEIFHEMGDAIRFGSDVRDGGAFEDADIPGSPLPGIRNQPVHHDPVGFDKGFGGNGIEVRHALIYLDRIQHFLNFLLPPDDPLPLQQSGDLIEIQRVPLNRQASLNRPDPI